MSASPRTVPETTQAHTGALKREHSRVLEALNDAVTAKSIAEQDLVNLQVRLASAMRDTLNEERALATARAELQATAATKNETVRGLAALVQEITVRSEELLNLQPQIKDTEAAIADLKKQESNIVESIDILKKEAVQAQQSVTALLRQRELLNESLEMIKGSIAEEAQRLVKIREEHAAKLATTKQQIQEEQAKFGSAEKSIAEREKFINRQISSVGAIQKRINKLYAVHFPGNTPPVL